MAESLSSGWTGLMKAGFGLRLEGFFLVFGIEADYRVTRKRAILILSKQKNIARALDGLPRRLHHPARYPHRCLAVLDPIAL